MSWYNFFRASEAQDRIKAFDSLAAVGVLPLAIGKDSNGKLKDPKINGAGWGNAPIDQRRKKLVDCVSRGEKVGIGCQPIGHVVIDIDTPGKNRDLLDKATEEAEILLFHGQMPPTLTIGTQGGRHLWFKAPQELINFWGDMGKRAIQLPCGGAAEIFLGIPSKQTQVAMPPSDGKEIEVEMEPVDLPAHAVKTIMEILNPPRPSNFPRAVSNVSNGSQEEEFFTRRAGKIIDFIARAQHPNRHAAFRGGVITIAGYASGIGCYHLKDWAISKAKEAHKYAKPEVSDRVADLTAEWAWERGKGWPLLPDWIDRKRRNENYIIEDGGNYDAAEHVEQATPADIEVPDLTAFDNPHKLARLWIDHQGPRRVVHWQCEFWQWELGRYDLIPDGEFESRLSRWIDGVFAVHAKEQYLTTDDPEKRSKIKTKPVTPGVVESVKKAIASLTTQEIRNIDAMPAWITPHDWDARDVVTMRNCMLNPKLMETKELTCNLFSRYQTDYDFVPDAPEPKRWIKFLKGIWPDDRDCIEALQMWFGYCLTQDTRQQKILLLVGPPRSGKGTISRILTAVVGAANVASPSLGDLAQPFGLAKCIGRPLAIIPDARIGNRVDQALIVERLLSISGEDRVAIDRKYRESWEGRLPTRLMVCSNELPRLQDTTGALPNRYLVLPMVKSFLGEEDKNLEKEIMAELPGIVLWAIAGFHKLAAAGKISQPKAGQERLNVLEDLCSPILAFFREFYTETGDVADKIPADDLQREWKEWCEKTGHMAGSVQNFLKNLTDAHPRISKKKARVNNASTWAYVGIRRKEDDLSVPSY